MVRIFDTANLAACLSSWHCEYSPPVSCVRYTPNGKYLLVGTLDNKLRLFPTSSDSNASNNVYSPLRAYSGHKATNYTSQACFFVNETAAAAAVRGSSGNDGTRAEVATEAKAEDGKADGKAEGAKFVISGSEDGSLHCWDVDSAELVQTLQGHTDAVLSVACNPNSDIDGGQIASTGRDSTVKLWSVKGFRG